MAEELYFLQNLGLALLLGSLIGLERERDRPLDRHKGDTHEFGGIRTMALVSMLGYLAYGLFEGSVLFSILTAGFLLLLVASYVISSYQNRNSGATTEIAGLFSYLVGVLMAMDFTLYAAVVTLLVTLLLYFKETLHRFAHRIEQVELYDTLKFIAIVFVILPLLPNQNYGPLEVLNPYEIWLIVVLISTISFVSYIAIKLAGPKNGIGMGGFLGGLISSTAVSISFSQLSRKTVRVVNPFVFGIVIACSAMFFRVLVTISILNPILLSSLVFPLGLMGGVGLLIALYFWFKQDHQRVQKFSSQDLNVKSPFQLSSAIKFGVLFAGLLFISKFAADYFGDQGLYLTAFFSGILDVDAITVSMADLSRSGQISTHAASMAITIAAMTNTLSKGCIVLFFGSRGVGVKVLLGLLLIVLTGMIVVLG